MSDSSLSAPHFHNEAAAYAYVEARLWPRGAVCPKCGVIGGHYQLKGKSTRSPQPIMIGQELFMSC